MLKIFHVTIQLYGLRFLKINPFHLTRHVAISRRVKKSAFCSLFIFSLHNISPQYISPGFAPHILDASILIMIATGNSPALTGLPDELLIQIFNLLPSLHDVSALCLVSRRINSVADPILHKSILFEHPKHHLTFSESLATRPRRGSIIQNVRLDYPSHELSDILHHSGGSFRDGFSHAISTMSNLESLEVSVPESLLHGIGTLFNGPFDLACLKTCKSSLYNFVGQTDFNRYHVLSDRGWRVLGSPRKYPHIQSSYLGKSHHSKSETRRARF